MAQKKNVGTVKIMEMKAGDIYSYQVSLEIF